MLTIFQTSGLRPIHPVHALLLAFTAPMCLGALLSDIAYASTYQIQWANFAAWLIMGALVGGGFALLWALISALRERAARSRRQLVYALLLLAMWIVSFVNALVHAKDAWAAMPAGLWLSLTATVFALLASWIGFSGLRAGDLK
ncbi:DUF2231 domain-containing protein [Terricaulis sp.]|uniref:DUF2231 domain-containing protein n=1 Tax=Terricaulis sp. TaxID=2768686 RepID=UPI002AC477C2|nr:DUF2231 domain-containing protein [Terricaulis sp.]MDZ4689890.1 DUF2231 domain-containing protein [Terricaulis sp.]